MVKSEVQSATEEGVYELLREVERNHLEGLTFIESICEYCSSRAIDVEDIVPIIPPSLMTKIRAEAISKKLIKTGKLMKLR